MVAISVIAVLFNACAGPVITTPTATTPEPTPTLTSLPEQIISPAPIHEVDVRVAESFPPQVFVYIKGGLSDGYTTFHNLTTVRSGNTINIEVTTTRPKDAICTQIYSYFEKNVNLGTDFISGQTYTINVNDKTINFVME